MECSSKEQISINLFIQRQCMEMLYVKFPKFSRSDCIFIKLISIEKVIWKSMQHCCDPQLNQLLFCFLHLDESLDTWQKSYSLVQRLNISLFSANWKSIKNKDCKLLTPKYLTVSLASGVTPLQANKETGVHTLRQLRLFC